MSRAVVESTGISLSERTARRVSQDDVESEATDPFFLLQSSWPCFLDDLESNPKRAQEQFCDLAYRYFVARPFAIFRRLPGWSLHDFVTEIVLHFIKDDCRRLRSYENQGLPFVAWLRVVAGSEGARNRPRRTPPFL